jgi:hypothetical protein
MHRSLPPLWFLSLLPLLLLLPLPLPLRLPLLLLLLPLLSFKARFTRGSES